MMAELSSARGDAKAAATLEEALVLTDGVEDVLLAAELWRAKASLSGSHGSINEARDAFQRARDLFVQAGAAHRVAQIDSAVARLAA